MDYFCGNIYTTDKRQPASKLKMFNHPFSIWTKVDFIYFYFFSKKLMQKLISSVLPLFSYRYMLTGFKMLHVKVI